MLAGGKRGLQVRTDRHKRKLRVNRNHHRKMDGENKRKIEENGK